MVWPKESACVSQIRIASLLFGGRGVVGVPELNRSVCVRHDDVSPSWGEICGKDCRVEACECVEQGSGGDVPQVAALVVTAGQEGGGVGGETDHSDTQPRGLDKGAKFGAGLEKSMVFAI